MSLFHRRLCSILMGTLIVTGCTTPVPVVPHSLRCDTSPELLVSTCAKPKPISSSATFETVVDTLREDRQALLECGIKLDALRDSLNRCNRQSDEFNGKVDDINGKNRVDDR